MTIPEIVRLDNEVRRTVHWNSPPDSPLESTEHSIGVRRTVHWNSPAESPWTVRQTNAYYYYYYYYLLKKNHKRELNTRPIEVTQHTEDHCTNWDFFSVNN
jgi:hypothetical protein